MATGDSRKRSDFVSFGRMTHAGGRWRKVFDESTYKLVLESSIDLSPDEEAAVVGYLIALRALLKG